MIEKILKINVAKNTFQIGFLVIKDLRFDLRYNISKPPPSFLLNINDPGQMETHYLIGNLFENLIIIDLLNNRLNAGLPPNLYFYRDSNKNEVDCIVEDAKLQAVEIKSSRTFSPGFVKGLSNFTNISGLDKENGIVVYGGDDQFVFKNFRVLPWKNITDI